MRNLSYILLGMLLLCSLSANSQDDRISADSARVIRFTYRIGQNTPDMSARVNKINLSRLIGNLNSLRAAGDSLIVDLTYFCAPGGINAINRGVGESRANVLIKDLAERTQLPDSVFVITNGEEGWDELCKILSRSDIDDADEIIEIIKGRPDERIMRLKKLNNGKTYSMLKESVFPKLREGINVTFGSPRAVDSRLTAIRMFNIGGSYADSCGINCLCAYKAPPIQKVIEKVVYVSLDTPDHSFAGDFALKTNLIYDFIATPSIELEYRFHRNWSANVEYDMAWWKNKKKNKSYEIAIASPEVRWWFPSVTPMKGYYVGVFPGYTWFDFENGGTGHRGYGVFGGISFGLSHPITSQLAFEAGLGVGYMNLRYKDYEPFDGHNVYSKEKATGYFGPLKIKFAIVWHPWGGSSKKVKAVK